MTDYRVSSGVWSGANLFGCFVAGFMKVVREAPGGRVVCFFYGVLQVCSVRLQAYFVSCRALMKTSPSLHHHQNKDPHIHAPREEGFVYQGSSSRR